MSTQLRFRRGNTTQTNAFTGALAEVTVDTDKNVVVVHDGSTPGGFPAPKLSYVQAAFDAANSALSGGGSAGEYSQAAFIHANSAYDQANLAYNTANLSYNTGNLAYVQANLAYNTANLGYEHANLAFDTANLVWNDANTKVSKSGDTITGSLIVTDNVSANIIIAEKQFYSGDATRLATPLPNLIAQFTSQSETYVQVNAQNINPNGSSDFVVTADIGTDTEFYIDLGLFGSTFSNTNPINSIGNAAYPLDGYLYVQGSANGSMGGNLIIGTTSTVAPTNIRLIVGGINEENVVATFDSTGNTTIHGHLLPHQANTYDIGSATTPWHSLWLGPESLHIGTIKISQNTVTGQLVISGASDISLTNSSVPSTGSISNTANAAFTQANAGFEVANSSSTYANGAFIQANAAFDAANSSGVYANGAFVQSNASFEVANSASTYANIAFVHANSAYLHANAAYEAANNVFPQVQPAFDTANSASLYANGAFVQANAAFEVANSSSIYANGSFIQANAAFIHANAAFGVANNALNVTTGGTVTGDVTITGNLIINGTTSTVNTTTIQVTDSLIKLANNNTIGDSLDIGFYGLYDDGATKYTGLIRQAAGNYFLFHELENDPSSNTLAPGSMTPANTATLVANVSSYNITINGRDVEIYLQSAFDTANSSGNTATSAGIYANGSFVQANSGFTHANAAFEVANSASVYANGAFTTANSAGVYANGAFIQANAAFDTANSKVSKSGDTITGTLHIANTTGSGSNTTGALTLDGGIGVKGYVYADGLYDSDRRVLTVADAAFESGNSGQATAIVAGYYANLAYVQANSAYDTANSAGVYANAAFIQANAAYDTANSAGVYANGAFIQANAAFGVANSTATYATGAFIQANSAYDAANSAGVYANGAFVQANAAFDVANSASTYANSAYSKANSVIDTVTTVVSTTSATNVYVFDKTTYRTVKSIAQMTRGTEYHSIELIMIHDDANVYLSQYGEIKTGNNLGSFDASISGSNVEIQVTTTGSPTTVIISTQRMPV